MSLPDPEHDCISLATFRRNGTEVRTPVWFVVSDGKVWVFTLLGTWKVKRLRRDPRVRFAPCNSSGRRILGPWSEGQARLDEAPERVEWLRKAYKAKYTWQYFLIVQVLYRLLGRHGPGLAIEITQTA